jgi:hypothetical protein
MQQRQLEPENRRSLFKPSPPVLDAPGSHDDRKDRKASRRTRGRRE